MRARTKIRNVQLSDYYLLDQSSDKLGMIHVIVISFYLFYHQESPGSKLRENCRALMCNPSVKHG
jgi:hypothetical protein